MLARDVGLQSPERRRLFQVQLPQRLARLCQRGERLLTQSWDINAMYLLAEDAALIADACRALDAHAIADCAEALREQVAPLLHPACLPDRAASARIGELIMQLSRLQLPAALASSAPSTDALAVAGAIRELGFPLLVTPPQDYWLRFRDPSLTSAAPLPDASPARKQRNQRRAPLKLAPADPASSDHLLRHVAACLAMDDAGARAGGLLVLAIEDVAAHRARLGVARCTALFAEIGAFLIDHVSARTIVASDTDDRFLVFNPDSEANLLEAYALNLRDRIAREPFTSDPAGRTVFDVGVCPFDAGASHAHAMRDAAQNAIDNARMAGRHGVFVVRDVQKAMDAELVERIRFALDGSGFELLFQPIVSLRGEEQEQFQALLRLSGDDCRLHAAAEVIPVATRAGLIGAVDRWTLATCVDLIDARSRSGRSSRLFISQSLDSMRDPRGPAWFGALLRRRGAAGSAFSLVLRANDAASALADLDRYASAMRALGASVTLAGFEAGVVGKRLLRELPPDFIKLSRRYLHLDDEAIRGELHALVELAHEVGTRVIAPRVEDARGTAALWTAGVDFIQGNFVQPADKELAFDFQASVM